MAQPCQRVAGGWWALENPQGFEMSLVPGQASKQVWKLSIGPGTQETCWLWFSWYGWHSHRPIDSQ